MTIDLRSDVFEPALERMKKRAESLRNINSPRFKSNGIEGWFKVELVAALGDKVKAICGKGPDIIFEDETLVELKGANNFPPSYILKPTQKPTENPTENPDIKKKNIGKYHCPCLFLANLTRTNGKIGKVPAKFKDDRKEDFKVIALEVFSDDGWVIGLVKPRRQLDDKE